MPYQSDIHVRQLEVGDFSFVREVAGSQPNFTIPPPYVLWLLLRIKDAVCLIAEGSREGPLAYLLSVPIEAPSKTMYVWQLAASEEGQKKRAVIELLTTWRRIMKKLNVRAVVFSTVPGSPQQRLIGTYAERLFASSPIQITSIPDSVCRGESEYRLEFRLAAEHNRAQ